MYHACLLIHGPPPQRWRDPRNVVITGEYYNYRTEVIKWLRANFEMRGDVMPWFDSYHDWTQEKRNDNEYHCLQGAC